MRIVEDTPFAVRIASQWLGTQFAPPAIGLVVLDDEKKIPAGVVVLNNRTDRNIDFGALGVGCWTPRVVRDIIRYVFGELRCRRMSAVVRASNMKAIRSLESAGFVQEGIAPEWFDDGETAIRYGLTASSQKLVRNL